MPGPTAEWSKCSTAVKNVRPKLVEFGEKISDRNSVWIAALPVVGITITSNDDKLPSLNFDCRV